MEFEDNGVSFLDAGTKRTAEGFMQAVVRCARTGCQVYRARDIGLEGDDLISVYRPEDAVFARASLSSYARKPITVGHPQQDVTADNAKDLAVGWIDPEIARDGEYVRVPIQISDAAAIRAVELGTREISMGYTTPIEYRDGVAPDGTPYQAVQTGPIQINHLALVDRARGGSSLRIGDAAGADQWGARPVHDDAGGREMPPTMRTMMVDGLSVETTEAGATAIERLQKDVSDLNKRLADAEKASADAIAAKDAEIAKKDGEIDGLKAKVLTDEALAERVRARADLIGKAAKVAPDAKLSDAASDADIKRAAVAARLGDDAINDKSEAYVDVRFDDLLAAADSKPGGGDHFRDALKSGTPAPKGNPIHDALAEQNDRLANAWKMEPQGPAKGAAA